MENFENEDHVLEALLVMVKPVAQTFIEGIELHQFKEFDR